MKKQLTLILSLILGLAMACAAQEQVNDFVIVGSVSGDQNMKQIESRYQQRPDALFIKTSSMSAAEQISKALEGRKINDLHIFVKGDQQGLFLTDIPVTLANASDFSAQFNGWRKSVAGKVVVHNQTGASTPQYNQLLDKMKELTGLEIELKQ
jgi:hypothetical protein